MLGSFTKKGKKRAFEVWLISLEILIEHLQVMSYMEVAPALGSDSWSSSAVFDVLSPLAFRFYDEGHIPLFILACLIVLATLVLYLFYYDTIHMSNNMRKSNLRSWIIVADHVIFGVGFIPLLSQFVSSQYCNTEKEMKFLDDVDCWDISHVMMLQIGFLFIGLLVVEGGAIFPVLKNERNAVDARRESHFPAIYKSLIVGIVIIWAPIKYPLFGAALTLFTMGYLFYMKCYYESLINCAFMGVLAGQCWVFICAEAVYYDQDIGTYMLSGWGGAVIIGYLAMLWRGRGSKTPVIPNVHHKEVATMLKVPQSENPGIIQTNNLEFQVQR